jgi:hypothetical protein
VEIIQSAKTWSGTSSANKQDRTDGVSGAAIFWPDFAAQRAAAENYIVTDDHADCRAAANRRVT